MSKIEFIQPDNLSNPGGYSHVVRAEASTLIFISGQVAYDENLQVVGEGDLASQTRQIMENLKLALGAAGASFHDVIKFTIFVVDYRPEFRDRIIAVRMNSSILPDPRQALCLGSNHSRGPNC